MSFVDRTLARIGLARISASTGAPFHGASYSRLNMDWATSILSADQESRLSLRAMRARCRNLANNNDYALRFLNKAKQNVIGPNGIRLQMKLDEEQPGAAALNRAVEDAFLRWAEQASADQQQTWVDVQQLALATVLQDGEAFLRRVNGYPYNDFRFAVQFIDADQVDATLTRTRMPNDPQQPNEIRLGVEVDEWRRPVAYWTFEGHPSEFAGTARVRIPAAEIKHAYVMRRLGQTRGIPWMHAAMTHMHMLGAYEEAELVAARLNACKIGYFVSKTGDEYAGKRNKKGDPIHAPAAPGEWEELPEGIEPKPVDWNHPNTALPEFLRALLGSAAAGLDVSYATLSGDLRSVNFSSIRHGVLDERAGWRVLQMFAISHLVKPVFADWLTMAVTSGQLSLPGRLPLSAILEAARFIPLGWTWVDPLKDSQASIMDIRSCQSSLQRQCAELGLDWREVIDERAEEIKYALAKGVTIDLTTSGSGGVEGDTATEDPQRAAEPTKTTPGTAPNRKQPKPNGSALDDSHLVRLPQ